MSFHRRLHVGEVADLERTDDLALQRADRLLQRLTVQWFIQKPVNRW
jgi:hypothetical protein